MEPPQTAIPPERLGPGRRACRQGRLVCRPGQGGGAGQRGLAPFLGLPGDLAALEQWVEGGGPEAGLTAGRVGLVWVRGLLAVEAEGGADQAVVAAPVIAAVAAEARASPAGGVRLASSAAGDANGARPPSGHPGQQHVDQGPQDDSHRHGHTEGYDQGDNIK